MTMRSKQKILVAVSAMAALFAFGLLNDAPEGRRLELAGDEVETETAPPDIAETEMRDALPPPPSSALTPQAGSPAVRAAVERPTDAVAGTQATFHRRSPAPMAASPGSMPTRTEILPESSDGGTRHPIDRDGIRAAVTAAMPQVRECYEEWIRLQPDLGGKVKVIFTIDTDDGETGKVESVSLGDAGMGHLGIESCILAAFEELRFEAPLDGPINVTYPLSFSPSGQGR